jgi:hypothetical protein
MDARFDAMETRMDQRLDAMQAHIDKRATFIAGPIGLIATQI